MGCTLQAYGLQLIFECSTDNISKCSQGQSNALRRVFIPFNHRPCFAACDQYDNLSIFQGNERQSCDKEIEGVLTGLVTPNDDAIVLIRDKHSLTPRRKIDLVFKNQKNGRLDLKTIGELGHTIDPKIYGLAIRGQESKLGCLLVFPMGAS